MLLFQVSSVMHCWAPFGLSDPEDLSATFNQNQSALIKNCYVSVPFIFTRFLLVCNNSSKFIIYELHGSGTVSNIYFVSIFIYLWISHMRQYQLRVLVDHIWHYGVFLYVNEPVHAQADQVRFIIVHFLVCTDRYRYTNISNLFYIRFDKWGPRSLSASLLH